MDDGYYCDYCKCKLTEETGHLKGRQKQHPKYVDLCCQCSCYKQFVYEPNEKVFVKVESPYED